MRPLRGLLQRMISFTPWRLATRGLSGHRRSHAAVAAGVALATAVLVGALVVGGSVRGSLRGLVLDRLGWIDYVISPGTNFRVALTKELPYRAEPLLIVPASISHRADGETRHASRVSLIGCRPDFFTFGDDVPGPGFASGARISQSLADELGLTGGESVVVRTATASNLPADSALGERGDTVASARIEVTRVLPPKGLARFSLAPSQAEPRNVFVPLDVVQKLIDAPGECNVAAVVDAGPTPEVKPRLADYGLAFDATVDPATWQLESRELVLPETIVEAANRAWAPLSRVAANTYLANTIKLGEKSIPYSTVAGVGGAAELLPTKELADDEIALTRWAADDLGAKVGDRVRLTFYEPESTHGVLKEAAPAEFTLAQIVELTDAEGQPTAANDRLWTPQLEGVTDAESINDWDLPFELVEPIRDADEAYWDEYNTTPKAFVSLATGQRLWGSRWGDTSLVRVLAPEALPEDLAAQLLAEIDPADLGFAPRAIKAEGLKAASGSTPFDVLFLLFSMFLIGSALLLIVLLVWLAIDARRREMGVLGAVGFDRKSVRRALIRELGPVSAVGAILGAAIGVAYAAVLLLLLRTVWLDAIGTPFLELHASPPTVIVGAISAWLLAMANILFAVRRATKEPPKTLLGGETPQPTAEATNARRYATGIGFGCATLAGIATMTGGTLQGEAAAGAFFAAGAAILTALIAGLYALATSRRDRPAGGLSLGGLAAANSVRRPGRALLTIGLVAAASFLILATSAFRLPPTESGTGGFDLVGESDQPLHYDLATEDGRFELGFGSKEEATLAGASVYAFRVQPGEDASCRNLYQTTQPRVLGVSERFTQQADEAITPFVWAATAATGDDSPWSVLAQPPREEGVVPVVLDFNTAMYSLKLYGGVGSQFKIRDEVGEEVTVEVVGLLKNSVLQGDLLVGEADFLRLYPSASGSRYFLIGSQSPEAVAATLEDTLSDYGFDAQSAPDRLAGFLAVQNTYLSTFQALGGLGLALGAVGLAIAQFRDLSERRGELALMRAAGFGAKRLRRLVLRENLTLLALGLIVGAMGAAAALAPLAATSDARPPWLMAGVLLAATLGIGLAAGRLAANRALAAPVTAALRGE